MKLNWKTWVTTGTLSAAVCAGLSWSTDGVSLAETSPNGARRAPATNSGESDLQRELRALYQKNGREMPDMDMDSIPVQPPEPGQVVYPTQRPTAPAVRTAPPPRQPNWFERVILRKKAAAAQQPVTPQVTPPVTQSRTSPPARPIAQPATQTAVPRTAQRPAQGLARPAAATVSQSREVAPRAPANFSEGTSPRITPKQTREPAELPAATQEDAFFDDVPSLGNEPEENLDVFSDAPAAQQPQDNPFEEPSLSSEPQAEPAEETPFAEPAEDNPFTGLELNMPTERPATPDEEPVVEQKSESNPLDKDEFDDLFAEPEGALKQPPAPPVPPREPDPFADETPAPQPIEAARPVEAPQLKETTKRAPAVTPAPVAPAAPAPVAPVAPAQIAPVAPAPVSKPAFEAASEDDDSGFNGFCPVTLREGRRLVPSVSEIEAVYHGQTYCFASEEAKAKFLGQPSLYVPAFDGDDPVLLGEENEHQRGSLEFSAWFRGKLYLFESVESLGRFQRTPTKFAEAPSAVPAPPVVKETAPMPAQPTAPRSVALPPAPQSLPETGNAGVDNDADPFGAAPAATKPRTLPRTAPRSGEPQPLPAISPVETKSRTTAPRSTTPRATAPRATAPRATAPRTTAPRGAVRANTPASLTEQQPATSARVAPAAPPSTAPRIAPVAPVTEAPPPRPSAPVRPNFKTPEIYRSPNRQRADGPVVISVTGDEDE